MSFKTLGIINLILLLLVETQSSTLYDGMISNLMNMVRNYRDTISNSDLLKTMLNMINLEEYMLPTDWPSPKDHEKVYDFVIIGSGSAGSAIANRLTEISDWEILLLEAGKGENLAASLPIIAPILQLSHYNWDYLMDYQPNFARGMDNQRLAWPRGKALGGTSVINYMIYTRGNPRDFNRWAKEGNPGWSYQDVLPYYIKSENSNLLRSNLNFHGTNGPLNVEDIYQSPLLGSFIGAGAEMGYPFVDYSSNNQIGFSSIQANTKFGRRHSVARAYLHPIKDRKNLHILTSSFVTKILINKNKRAYGVEYERDGTLHRVYVRKEVILSAGALASPQLLMLSGIGPERELLKFGVTPIQDLPVGMNLHDHITYVGLNFLINQDVGVSFRKCLQPSSVTSWIYNGTGPNSSLGGVGGIAYIKTSADTDPDPNFPDMELLFVDGALGLDFGVTAKTMRIRDEVYRKYWNPIAFKPAWTVFPMLLHPKSTGYLTLKSRNPRDPPRFIGNYFSDPNNQDLKTMLAAIRFIISLSKTKSFERFESTLYDAPVPGCEHHRFNSDPYWICALETFSITLHHQVGTCKMGPADDPGAVVNHELKVYGIRGLRVADTSVIPHALTAHTNAPSVMVGEKTADIIKSNWGRT